MKRIMKIVLLIGIMLLSLWFVGCSSEKTEEKKVKDLEFTVVEEADIPKELMEIIEEKKEEPFKITYSNKEYLYIVVGYGTKNTGGYSITVDDLYLTSNSICIDTNLVGPEKQDLVLQAITYPYIVVKVEFMDKSVTFN